MIFVTRVNEPLVLKNNKANWLLDYLTALKTYRFNPTKPNKEILIQKENKYRQVEVKNALKIMFAGKLFETSNCSAEN